MPAPQTVLFVRAPRRGTVKTRLARSLGDDNALDAYRTLLTVTCKALRELNHVELRVTPDDGLRELVSWRAPGWTLAPQGTGSLGERLAAAVVDHFRNGAASVVIIGSDCPETTAEDIRAAHQALAASDVVLGPATDGGYWLIGLRRPTVGVFDNIAWSTDAVFRKTCERAASLNLSLATLRPLDDIDTHEDWLRWKGKVPSLQIEGRVPPPGETHEPTREGTQQVSGNWPLGTGDSLQTSNFPHSLLTSTATPPDVADEVTRQRRIPGTGN